MARASALVHGTDRVMLAHVAASAPDERRPQRPPPGHPNRMMHRRRWCSEDGRVHRDKRGVMMADQVDRSVLPLRRPAFDGVVNRTLAGSRPDWNILGSPQAPEG